MRKKFIVEFSPLPIPTEPPDAPGGFYFYLSPQWAAYVRGVVAILGFRRFWAREPEKYDIILQWVYKLLDEIELPPGETIEVPIYVPIDLGDYDNEECEECVATCNCGNAANVRFCDGKFEYKNSDGLWVDLPITADNVAPSTPTDDELPEPSSGIACAKAHALFDVVADYMEVLARTAPEAIDSPLGDFINFTVGNNNYIWYARFLADESSLPAKAWDFNIAVALWTYGMNMGDIDTLWQGVKEVIQDNFVCEWQNKLGKLAKLEASELAAYRAIEWDSGNVDLDKVLKGITTRIATSEHIKERVALYAQNGGYVCSCAGSTPVEPPVDPTDPPEDGCIKVYPGVRAYAPYDGQNFVAPLDYWLENELYGTFNNGEILTSAAGNNGAGADLFRGGAVFEISEGAEIIEIRWDWSSPYTQGTSSRTYQFSVYSWINEDADSVLSGDVTVTGGTGASVVVPVSGDWVARSHVSIGAFATAGEGNLNQIKVRNIQFRIKSAADGFDGWVSAGQDLCE